VRGSTFMLLLLSLCVGTVRADQVALKNGDRLSGTIVKSDGKTLVLKTDFAGELTIKWDAVSGINSTEPLHVVLKDGRTVAGPVSSTGDKLEVATKESGTVAAEKDSVLAVRNDAEEAEYQYELHPRFIDLWSGLLDTGLSLTRGNSQTLNFTLAGKAARVSKRNKVSLYATAIYASDDTTPPNRTTADARRGGIRDDYDLREHLFVFGFTDFESDRFQNLDLRNVIGGGFGYHVIKTPTKTFDVFGGASYDREQFSAIPPVPPATVGTPSETRNSAEVVLGETFNWKVSGRTTVTEGFSIFPNMSESGSYRFTFDATAATKLKNWLSWQVTYSDRYLSNPQPGFKKNDLLLSTGLRLTYGKGVF
jgi:putative salt-induced outer membrane protein YdiY